MEILLVALVAGGVITAAHFWRRSRASKEPRALPAPVEERSIDGLRPGDVVVHEGQDLIVAEAMTFVDGEHRWHEVRLDDAGDEHWLLVPDDDPDGVWLGRPIEPPAIGDEPPECVDRAGVVLRLSRCGSARRDDPDGPLVERGYWNYGLVGDHRLWIRRDEERAAWSSYEGRRVPRHTVDVLPGS